MEYLLHNFEKIKAMSHLYRTIHIDFPLDVEFIDNIVSNFLLYADIKILPRERKICHNLSKLLFRQI